MSTALETTNDTGSIMELATLSDAQFSALKTTVSTALDRIEELKASILDEGVDFGVIPGTDRPTLYQPGAQKLAAIFRLVPSFDVARTVQEQNGSLLVHYMAKCRLHRGTTAGPCIGEGIGSANSFEKKHRYRKGERACPTCKASGTLRLTRRGTPNEGFWCIPDRGGCGGNFEKNDPAVTKQSVGDVENVDPMDTDNTLAKMSKKRAFVDAVLTVTMSSGLFTQDLEETQEATGHERRAAIEQFAVLCRTNGLTKMGDVFKLIGDLVGVEVKNWKELSDWSVREVRALTRKAEEHFDVIKLRADTSESSAVVEGDE